MLKSFFIWWHHITRPHCEQCVIENEDNFQKSLYCNSCESLKSENNFLREQNRILLDKLVNPSVPSEPIVNDETLKPLTNYRKPFSVIRQELEKADKLEAARRDKEILEKVAAKPDTTVSPIVDEDGKIDPKKVEAELENLDKEIVANG